MNDKTQKRHLLVYPGVTSDGRTKEGLMLIMFEKMISPNGTSSSGGFHTLLNHVLEQTLLIRSKLMVGY